MSTKEFLSHCTLNGSNWTAMLLSGVKKLWPEKLEQFPDNHKFKFVEVLKIVRESGVVL